MSYTARAFAIVMLTVFTATACRSAPPTPPTVVAQTLATAPSPPSTPPPQQQQPTAPANPTAGPGAAMYSLLTIESPLDQAQYLAQVNMQSDDAATWTHEKSVVATMPSGEMYDVGGFCRLFGRADGQSFDVIYGGSFGDKYNGDVFRIFDAELNALTAPVSFSPAGGDFAIDSDGNYYYLLAGHPKGWALRKYDSAFSEVGMAVVELPAGHVNNDQMLRLYDGLLYLSSLFNPAVAGSPAGTPPNPGPDVDDYTHVWVYDTDLNYVADHILDDHGNINGGTLLKYGDRSAYIAADNFFRNNLVALLYDSQWNYLETKMLQPNAQWAMGAVESGGLLYIAYHRGEHGHGDVVVDIYDQQWTLQETFDVTRVSDQYNAQRPWLQILGDTLYVSYDVGREPRGVLDLQCVVSAFRKR